MNPKEKAVELLDSFYMPINLKTDYKEAKQCALICVDEIIEAINFDWMEEQNLDRQHAYWQEVRKEIEQL